jgi:hypothetical protein
MMDNMFMDVRGIALALFAISLTAGSKTSMYMQLGDKGAYLLAL